MEKKRDYNGLVNRKKINNALQLDLFNYWSNLSKTTGYNKSKLLDASMMLLKNLYEKEGIEGLQKIINQVETQKDPN